MAAVDLMSEHERRLIQDCLHTAVEGPIFDDEEFHTLIGFERAEVAVVLAAWPHADNASSQEAIVNNVLNMLLGHPKASRHLAATRQEIAHILARWRGDGQFDSTARGTYDRLG